LGRENSETFFYGAFITKVFRFFAVFVRETERKKLTKFNVQILQHAGFHADLQPLKKLQKMHADKGLYCTYQQVCIIKLLKR
jgi:hypothetical protein